jgi:hypothetical protein
VLQVLTKKAWSTVPTWQNVWKRSFRKVAKSITNGLPRGGQSRALITNSIFNPQLLGCILRP